MTAGRRVQGVARACIPVLWAREGTGGRGRLGRDSSGDSGRRRQQPTGTCRACSAREGGGNCMLRIPVSSSVCVLSAFVCSPSGLSGSGLG